MYISILLRKIALANHGIKCITQLRAASMSSLSSPSASISALREQLRAFPEYSAAQADISRGKFQQALPAMQRIHEVVSGAMGSKSALAGLIDRERSLLLQLSGNFEGADKILANARVNAADDSEVVRALQQSVQNRLMWGSMSGAEAHAAEAVNICENAGALMPLPLIASSYSMRGVCALQMHDWDAAEEFLQLAARWSQTPITQIIALNNLGCVHWMLPYEKEGGTSSLRVDTRQLTISQGKLWQSPQKLGTQDESQAKEALGYWDEALEEALKGEGEGDAASAAAAMCGPTGGLATMLGPDMEKSARVVPGAASVPAKKSRVRSEDEILAIRLADCQFAVAYAGIICNAAAACTHVGNKQRSGELLASAVKALDAHKSDLRAQPMLGRVLNLLAFANMAESNAVTAEGLFRASMEYLQGPFARHQPLWRGELGLARGGYGVLLSKWEKRQQDCKRELAAAEELRQEGEKWAAGKSFHQSYQFPL